MFEPNPWLISAVAAGALAALGGVVWVWRRRLTPEERERRRRLEVNARGRITDGVITEVLTIEAPPGRASHLLHYSYDLHGVSYSAAQDVTDLLEHLRRDPGCIGGPSSVNYLPRNPSNSIVICEQWSGLR